MVESTSTDGYPCAQDGGPDSGWHFHPPESHSGSKYLGECAVGHYIPLIVCVRPKKVNENFSLVVLGGSISLWFYLLFVKLVKAGGRAISKVEQIVDIISNHQKVVLASEFNQLLTAIYKVKNHKRYVNIG